MALVAMLKMLSHDRYGLLESLYAFKSLGCFRVEMGLLVTFNDEVIVS